MILLIFCQNGKKKSQNWLVLILNAFKMFVLELNLLFRLSFVELRKETNQDIRDFKDLKGIIVFTFPQVGFTLIDNKLKLSKVGSVRIKKHRAIEGIIKTLTVCRSGEKWYACFFCEIQQAPLSKVEAVVGIDVGLESFATLSTGEKIKNPRFFREVEVKLAKAQRRLSKATKGSTDRKKQRKKVSNIHIKIANKRSDFAHKLSRQLVNQYQVIAFEKLDIQNMIGNHIEYFGHKLNKSINDAAWNQFIRYTVYKAEYAGRSVVLVNPRNTSKRCSRCGQIIEKDLSTRIHSCTCGLILDRDHNAAINILALGMQRLAKA
jgi:putative transposase